MEIQEKGSMQGETVVAPEVATSEDDNHVHASNINSGDNGVDVPARPSGWMYKQFKVGSYALPWYASPKFQLGMVAFVCFLCPGMYNAVNGLGAGGQVSSVDNDNALTALYATFAGVGFFAGSFTNRLGIRTTVSFGGFGYGLYVAALLCYNHTANKGFLIFAGATLGLCAGLLWTAQGAIMMSYPPEESKGRFISAFWMIFNLGSVIGSLIPLGENIKTTTSGTVSDGTYIAFIILMFAGAVLGLFLCDADKIIREDGSKVVLMKNPTWKSEFIGLYETLRSDYYIVLFFPMFLASNWFYTYQFNGFNGAYFDVRTRALNNTVYWASQILGALIVGFCLDLHSISRSMRAKGAFAFLLVSTMAIWGGGYAWELKQAVSSAHHLPAGEYAVQDWSDSGYIGSVFLYMFYGFYDAAFQISVYWFMGALSNSGRKTANFAGFYKGIQSAGGAITWQIDAKGTEYGVQFASTWGLLAASLVVAAPVIFWKIKDTVPLEDDLRDTNETAEDILPVHYGEKSVVADAAKV